MNQALINSIFKQSTGSQDAATLVGHRLSRFGRFLVLALLNSAVPMARPATQGTSSLSRAGTNMNGGSLPLLPRGYKALGGTDRASVNLSYTAMA